VRSPLAPVHRFFDRLTDHRIEQERSLVRRGRQYELSLTLRSLARMAVGMVALVATGWAPQPWDTVGWGAIGLMVGTWSMAVHNRATAYRSGWLEGRHHMFHQMKESRSPNDFVESALLYDAVHVLGLPGPDTPDTPEGLDRE
jgi:hypothetical protein